MLGLGFVCKIPLLIARALGLKATLGYIVDYRLGLGLEFGLRLPGTRTVNNYTALRFKGLAIRSAKL